MSNTTNTEARNFLAKLEKINFNTVDKNDNLLSPDGWKLSHSFKMHGIQAADGLSVQIVLNLRFNGGHVATWGCVAEADQAMFVKFIVTAINVAEGTEYNKARANSKLGKAMLDLL